MDRDADGTGKGSLEPRFLPASAGGALIGHAGIMLAGAAAGAIFTMGNELLAARFLGVAAYGLYALTLMLARTAETIAVFGVPVSVMHYLPAYLSRGEREHALGTIIGCIPLPLALGVVFALALWAGAEWVAENALGQPEAARFLVVLSFAIPLLALADLLSHVARGFSRALPYVLINLTPQLCIMAVLISLVFWHGPQIGVAYGQLAGLAIGVMAGVALVVRLVRTRIGSVRPAFSTRQLYGYAVPVIASHVVSMAMGWTDLFVLGIFTDAGTVGTYRGCMQIVLAFDLVGNAFAITTAPLYAVLIAEGQRAALQETYTAAIRLAALLAVPLLLVIIVNGSDLLGLLGPDFVAGAPALIVLACGQCVKVALGTAFVVLIMGGRQSLEAGNVVLAASVNLMLNLMLVPAFGPVGAAAATATSLIGLAALRCLQLRRLLGLRTLNETLLRVFLVTVPLGLAIWVTSLVLGLGPGSGLLPLLLRLAVMGAVIGAGLWLFCLNAEDRAMLLRLARRRGTAAAASQ